MNPEYINEMKCIGVGNILLIDTIFVLFLYDNNEANKGECLSQKG